MSPWHDSAVSSCGRAPHVAPFCFCVQETLHRRAGILLFWWGAGCYPCQGTRHCGPSGKEQMLCPCCRSLGKLRPEGKKCPLPCSFLEQPPPT